MGKGEKRDRLTLPVTVTEAHRGKTLDVDCAQETIILRDPAGEPLGTVTWQAVIEQICAATIQRPPEQMRAQPRVSFLSKVRYGTPGSRPAESRATGIGGGGLFIESTAPLPVGTDLELEFTLPERPAQWLKARGIVVWVCPKADQYTFSPGMGIRFTKIADEARGLVLALVESLRRRPLAD
ncbi:MAG: hypothetical protein EPO61_00170 [Nitrospirae bacterium]|nr:MAG: hypothetical protein EPO61_00170 [Nitrospirota bacterium]